MKIVLASHNKGKIQEVTDILAPFGIEVEPIPEDFPEIEEDGDSFEENAKIKARAVCKATGLPAVGDDSGLVIDALDGFPGIHSARWAGPNVSAHEKNQLLIERCCRFRRTSAAHSSCVWQRVFFRTDESCLCAVSAAARFSAKNTAPADSDMIRFSACRNTAAPSGSWHPM